MDAALLTQRLRHQAVALAPKRKVTDKSNATTLGAQQAGSGIFWVNGLAQGGCDCTPPASTPTADPTPLQTFVFATLEVVFQYISSTNCGPTRASRYFYLWMNTVATAYSWVQATGPLNRVVDGWNWSPHYPLPLAKEDYVATWMTQALVVAMPLLIPTVTAAHLLQLERNLRLWTPLEQATQAGLVKELGRFKQWKAAWLLWFSLRQTDGNVAAQAPPLFSQLPNGGILLDPAICQDITAYPQPTRWTPLVLKSIPKPYYTRTWETVRSIVLTAANDTTAKAAAAPYFPGYDTPARQTELDDVIAKTGLLGIPGLLSDTEKVVAEFWAGGPNTITPPGMFMWLWRQHGLAFQVATTQSYDTLFYSGLDLAIHLMEVGRVAWGLKLQYIEARPIQDIRRYYATTDLSGWQTTVDPATGGLLPAQDVSGCLWRPYQAANFVTPPFPDFVSGHSAYSQSFATVMSGWYGASIPTSLPTVAYDLPLFSPLFRGPQTQPFGVFAISPGTSEVQPSIVPATPLTLAFATWSDIALSAGYSRQWGGIHAMSAHVGAVAAANSVHAAIQAVLGLTPSG